MNIGRNIFALEGEWTNRLDDTDTVKSTLTFLHEIYSIDYIFRKTNTLDSLVNYVTKGTMDSYKKYGIILLAFHGSAAGIELDNKIHVSLEQLGDKCKGLLKDKLVHFSSCAVAKNSSSFKKFKAITGAKKVMGYTKDVDFLESTLFDIALLQKLNKSEQAGRVNNYMKNNYENLYNKLGFIMI